MLVSLIMSCAENTLQGYLWVPGEHPILCRQPVKSNQPGYERMFLYSSFKPNRVVPINIRMIAIEILPGSRGGEGQFWGLFTNLPPIFIVHL